MYDKGLGVDQNYAVAAEWYRLSAEQGIAFSQYNLGLMYRGGQGVARDDGEAVKWYRLAAEQGFASAQTNLGIMYAFGYGVPSSYIDAYMWGGLGASNGSPNGGKLRDDFARKMTATEVKEAKRRARDCVKKNYKGC